LSASHAFKSLPPALFGGTSSYPPTFPSSSNFNELAALEFSVIANALSGLVYKYVANRTTAQPTTNYHILATKLYDEGYISGNGEFEKVD